LIRKFAVFKKITGFLIISLLTLEMGSWIATKNNLFLVNTTPRIYAKEKPETSLGEWWNEKNIWGAWHKLNSQTRHRSKCFDVLLKSNEVGARDDSFENLKGESTILLGDSFAEGFGVNSKDSVANLLENSKFGNVLNFGTSGDFGILQQYLIYKNLAINYTHNNLIIFFFPQNDFTDNNYEYWVKTNARYFAKGKERFRPYFEVSKSNNFSYFIPYSAVKRENLYNTLIRPNNLTIFVQDYFWSANIIRTINILKVRKDKSKEIARVTDNLFYDAPLDSQKPVLFFMEKIIDLAKGKNIYLVPIPSYSDMLVAQNLKKQKTPYWKTRLLKMGENNPKLHILDLLQKKIQNPNKLFLSCDGHWSPKGNKWVAKQLISEK
jgi:hypothetical protein